MDKTMKISIIVPIYNVETYLRACVQSLIDQTYPNIEILLVDDGSTDNSGKICDELAEQDSRICVFHKPNGRTASARNLGVSKASGEYLLFIDPDDWFDLQTVERLVAEIEKTKADVVRFNYVREYDGYSQNNENFLLKNQVYEGEEYNTLLRRNLGLIGNELRYIEHFNFFASVCFACYRKSIIVENNLQFYDLNELGSFEDGLFNLQYLLSAKRFSYLDKHLYHYRRNNAGSYTSRSKDDFLEKSLVLFERIKNTMAGKMSEADFEQAYFNRIAYCTLELNLNAMKNRKTGFRERYKEIQTILKSEPCKTACKRFSLRYLPLKWKAYYSFIKMRWTLGVYLVTKTILYLKGRK